MAIVVGIKKTTKFQKQPSDNLLMPALCVGISKLYGLLGAWSYLLIPGVIPRFRVYYSSLLSTTVKYTLMKTLLMLCLIALITGCSDNDIQKANSLLKSRSLNLGEVERLDSIYDYQESFDCIIKANAIKSDVDSLLKERISVLSEMKQKQMQHEMERRAIQTKNTLENMIKTAYEYETQANSIKFRKSLDGERPIFLGYCYKSKNDSCTYVVYFNKEVSQILAIEKIVE